ncbi:MAG: TIR domain-containing protein [Bacteroidota bacterium]
MATFRHKVFVSYHHANDQWYKNRFEAMFSNYYNILVSKSVQIGDIDINLKTDTIRQKIRDVYLRDSTVTVVLIGSETWKRKHVDWEIGASIRHTQFNPRMGLSGILLPSYNTHYGIQYGKFNHCSIPPRLSDNIKRGYANIYDWSDNPQTVQAWIHTAFENRNKIIPDNSYPSFVNNRTIHTWC